MQIEEYDSMNLINFYIENGFDFDEKENYLGTNVKSFVILDGKTIIGAITFSSYKQKNFIEVVAVNKKYRNHGYGKSLLDKAKEQLEKPIYLVSKVDNFYLKNGFVYSDEDLINEGCLSCREFRITCFPKTMVYK